MGAWDVGRGRSDFNWEMLDLWLGAFAGGYTGKIDDNPGSNPNKKSKSKVPVNLLWMEAQSDPAVKESTELLTEIVIERMPVEMPVTYLLFEYLYLREYSNPSEAEVWRTAKDPLNTLRWKKLQEGKRWILDELAKVAPGFVLVVPDPIDPKGFVDNSRYKQRLAQRVFYTTVDRKGSREAIRIAAEASGYSKRHIKNIIPKEDRE